MSKDERKETVERIAEKFASLQDNEKSFIAGYMARAEEECAARKKEPAVAYSGPLCQDHFLKTF